jgi:hypothetical protein
MTPAMAGGVTDRRWSIGEIVSMIEAWETATRGGLVMARKPIRNPHYWRDLAEAARANAAQVEDMEFKMTILGIADSYERLARLTEEKFPDSEKSK